jgi:tetratricopeptide (TPR) repeat protein/transcriptional regulator with XRE-family HTH domain
VDSAHPTTFGTLLRHHRVVVGLTQEELAERAGVSPRSIGDIERGVSRAPQRNTVGLLATALGLTKDERRAFETMARRRAVPFPSLPQGPDVVAAAPAHDRSHHATSSLVGRAVELDLLDRHLQGDGPPILIFAGEPGLGKSRLLAEAAHLATNRGWCVLEDGCQRRGSQEPFAPVLRAVKGYLDRRTPAELREDLAGCAWLVRLLPELSEVIDDALPAWVLPPEQERRLMFDAVGRMLTNVARRECRAASSGIVLVLDDLQWAGQDAFDLLDAVLRAITTVSAGSRGPRLRIVGAYRDTEPRQHDVLERVLADWAHARLVTHHPLPPLAPEACERLVDEVLLGLEDRGETHDRAALREQILQRAGGVPFFVVSYAQALRQGEGAGGGDSVPWDIAQGVRQRVAALPETAQALLHMAAVIGRVAPLSLLSTVLAGPEEEVLTGVEAACHARLLLDAEHAVRFTHDVVREVVEADITSTRRARLHRRVAAAIEHVYRDSLADQYETLAYHYLRARAWEQAVDYAVLAGDRAVSRAAIHETLDQYGQALVVCGQLGAPADATALTVAEKRGFVCFDSGDFTAAVRDFEHMREAAHRLGDRHKEGLALAYAGMAAYYGHEFEVAERSLRAALDSSSAGFDDVRLSASIQLGSMLMVTDRHAEAAPLQRAAEELAPRVDDPLSRSWWAITGSETLHWRGRYDDALALLERWRGAVTSSRQVILQLWHTWERALAHGGRGDYDRALTLLDDVTATCIGIGETFIRARALNTAGWIYGELQHHERATALNDESLALARAMETADTEIASNARLNLGDSLAALGRHTEAEEHFRIVEEIVRHPRPEDRWMLWRYAQHLCHSYGELRLARGDTAGALADADECVRRAASSDSAKNIVKGRRLRGQVFLARGEARAAETELEDALAVAREIGNPPQLWRTVAAVGDLRQTLGEMGEARQAYGEALALIENVAAHLQDETLRVTFLSSPHVQDIRRRHHECGGSVK